MVVGGIPTRVADHATRVVSQAIDMVRLAREVAHPITGDPVQVSDSRQHFHISLTLIPSQILCEIRRPCH